jgi:hypothetical protein
MSYWSWIFLFVLGFPGYTKGLHHPRVQIGEQFRCH